MLSQGTVYELNSSYIQWGSIGLPGGAVVLLRHPYRPWSRRSKCCCKSVHMLNTVEVRCLQTLRLEYKNTFFHHSTNFLLTNYSFGKSVRTSTLCMTQVIFPIIVYKLIISLIFHCIIIPVGQTFTYTKLTVPLNSLENSRK